MEHVYEEIPKDGKHQVNLRLKSLIRGQKISILRVYLQIDGGDFRKRIYAKVLRDKIVVSNQNEKAVRHFRVILSKLKNSQTPRNLRKDAKIDDVYKENSHWVVEIKEVPPMMMGHEGTVRIWL